MGGPEVKQPRGRFRCHPGPEEAQAHRSFFVIILDIDMKPSRNALITHPVRMRIIGALAGRTLSTDQLAQILDDIPPASLYRHLALLIEGDQVAVVREAQSRSGSPRLLGLAEGAGLLNRADVDPQDKEENSHLVNAFLTRQIASYASALRDPQVIPGDWILRGLAADLSPEEEQEFREAVMALMTKIGALEPGPGRRRRSVFFGVLPDRDFPPKDSAPQEQTETKP
jgi:DNA-binding transcriptional ArsR family regulator